MEPFPIAEKSEPLLDVLNFVFERVGRTDVEGVVRCLQFPQIRVKVAQSALEWVPVFHDPEDGNASPEDELKNAEVSAQMNAAFEEAKRQARELLKSGAIPRFYGTGRYIWRDWKLLKPLGSGKRISIHIPDEWCLLPRDELKISIKNDVEFWAQYSGKGVGETRRTAKTNVQAMCRSILRKVDAYRPKFQAEEQAWLKRWEDAKQRHERQLEDEEIQREQLRILVKEALRYVSDGGTLRVPWMIAGEGSTPAESWLLYYTDEFNARAKEPVTHEERDQHGNIKRYWVENPHGGEIKTAGEQAEFMIGRMGRRAQDGCEKAFQRLYLLAAEAIRRFWLAVEAQPDLVKRIAPSWLSVPVMMNNSSLSKKELAKKLKKLPLATPPELSPRVDPDSPYHEAIGRIGEAVWWLLCQPPITFPFSDVHENSPDWMNDAWKLSREGCDNAEMYARKVYWKMRLAADQEKTGMDKPLRKRADKERERFVEAVVARILKQPRP